MPRMDQSFKYPKRGALQFQYPLSPLNYTEVTTPDK